jgi:hypothetical protein
LSGLAARMAINKPADRNPSFAILATVGLEIGQSRRFVCDLLFLLFALALRSRAIHSTRRALVARRTVEEPELNPDAGPSAFIELPIGGVCGFRCLQPPRILRCIGGDKDVCATSRPCLVEHQWRRNRRPTTKPPVEIFQPVKIGPPLDARLLDLGHARQPLLGAGNARARVGDILDDLWRKADQNGCNGRAIRVRIVRITAAVAAE